MASDENTVRIANEILAMGQDDSPMNAYYLLFQLATLQQIIEEWQEMRTGNSLNLTIDRVKVIPK